MGSNPTRCSSFLKGCPECRFPLLAYPSCLPRDVFIYTSVCTSTYARLKMCIYIYICSTVYEHQLQIHLKKCNAAKKGTPVRTHSLHANTTFIVTCHLQCLMNTLYVHIQYDLMYNNIYIYIYMYTYIHIHYDCLCL